MNQGSSVDLSFVEEEKLHTLLAQLANTVDERNVVQKSLEEAKNNYIEKYNLYLDAKEALLKAESDYNEVLSQLNAFLFEQNKETIPAKKEEAKKASVAQAAKTDFETATLKQKSLKDLKAEIAGTQEQISTHQKAIKDFNGAIAKLDETIGQLENEQASIKDVKGQVEKAYETYKKLCADPAGFMDVVDSDNDVVLGLYSKMGSMRTTYEEYATALNVFLGVEEQWNVNKAELDVALKAYEKADKVIQP